MQEKEITIKCGNKFTYEVGRKYVFPDFTLKYLGRYQDDPGDFPNKESTMFKGSKFSVFSDKSKIEVKCSGGTGLWSPRYFSFENKPYSILLWGDDCVIAEGEVEADVAAKLMGIGEKE